MILDMQIIHKHQYSTLENFVGIGAPVARAIIFEHSAIDYVSFLIHVDRNWRIWTRVTCWTYTTCCIFECNVLGGDIAVP
jgi:hypothetical protein